MKLRKVVAICGSLLTTLFIIMIYSAKDLTLFPNKKSSISEELEDNKWLHFEGRIKQLEVNLNKHHEAVGQIREAMKHIILQPSSSSTPIKNFNITPPSISNKNLLVSEMMYDSSCPIQLNVAPRTNIQMLDVYKKIKFDNPDGGVWKQGWKIEVDEHLWNKYHKLKVFVVPHSHNDPGWIKTIEEYYLAQTKHILNNMIEKLADDRRRKFIWAEISYFSMWWDDLDEDGKIAVKQLLQNNQLEIVTGGWVMNDEANSHWISIVQQLTEGHQWLQHHLNYTPKSSWAIDPFGMSLTQPYLLKEIGLQNMLIQRVHYSIKKEFASLRNLEFKWRQLWDRTGKTEIFTHMMPFYSYDIPHTCGPDPKICCQFDFKRLPGHGLRCPWRVAPQQITEMNVAQKAELLLDQYRKKSQLYRTNVLLIPLGDDFRYDHPTEWDVQYQNYQKLFDYMNSNLNLRVQIQFGTLSDYFDAVHAEKDDGQFPSFSGDFFTYADRDDHYWSGYYTSRPFYKRMDRVLLSYVRAAEIILTLAHLSGRPGSSWIADTYSGAGKMLSKARQDLALFQHHDGITGTAKDHVVIDYGQKMLAAITSTQFVIQQCVHILLLGTGADVPGSDTLHYNIDDVRHSHDSIAEHFTVTIGPELSTKKIVLYNSLTFTRIEVVSFYVSTAFVEVLDFNGHRVKCQISPVFEYGSTMSLSKYQLSFIANIPALALVSYTIKAVIEDQTPNETVHSAIKIYNQYADIIPPRGFTNIEVSPSANEFTLQNARVTAAFNNLGLLKAMKIGVHTIPVHLDFAKYGVRHTVERSGAYLFLPDGDALSIPIENTIVKVIDGPIISSVIVQLPYVHHTVRLFNTPGADGLGIEIENVVDIAKTSNFELVMRLSTNINNTDEFFTDVNGYQIMRRKRFKKLPLQANYYPIPTMAYIEDKNIRLTVLTASPLGCSSLREGHFEIMLDRRLNQDDNLGLGQGVLDNHPTKHVFRILLEKKTHSCKATIDNHPAGFPSLSAHVASQTLLNPLIRLLRTDDEDLTSLPAFTPISNDFGVDFTLPTLRTGVEVNEKDHVGIILHRQFLDVCFSDRILLQQFPLSHSTVNLSELLMTDSKSNFNKATLSFLKKGEALNVKDNITLCPMDIKAFTLLR